MQCKNNVREKRAKTKSERQRKKVPRKYHRPLATYRSHTISGWGGAPRSWADAFGNGSEGQHPTVWQRQGETSTLCCTRLCVSLYMCQYSFNWWQTFMVTCLLRLKSLPPSSDYSVKENMSGARCYCYRRCWHLVCDVCFCSADVWSCSAALSTPPQIIAQEQTSHSSQVSRPPLSMVFFFSFFFSPSPPPTHTHTHSVPVSNFILRRNIFLDSMEITSFAYKHNSVWWEHM